MTRLFGALVPEDQWERLFEVEDPERQSLLEQWTMKQTENKKEKNTLALRASEISMKSTHLNNKNSQH